MCNYFFLSLELQMIENCLTFEEIADGSFMSHVCVGYQITIYSIELWILWISGAYPCQNSLSISQSLLAMFLYREHIVFLNKFSEFQFDFWAIIRRW